MASALEEQWQSFHAALKEEHERDGKIYTSVMDARARIAFYGGAAAAVDIVAKAVRNPGPKNLQDLVELNKELLAFRHTVQALVNIILERRKQGDETSL